MNYTKIVMMPIRVPDCDYCWEPRAPHRICGNFDNEGGHPRCAMNLGTIEYDDAGGVKKPAECACLANPTLEPPPRLGGGSAPSGCCVSESDRKE